MGTRQDICLLHHAPVLIVEDEPLLAFELQVAVEDAAGEVVGPVGSCGAALALLKTSAVAAAILDVRLPDGDVTPVVEVLVARKIPMVFQSGFDLPLRLEELCPDVPFYKTPAPARLIVEKLAQMIRPEDWE
jgi:CheY-like chemotaxis protein